MEITLEIDDTIRLWRLERWPDDSHGLTYSLTGSLMLMGHIVSVTGVGETPQQAAQEMERAIQDIRNRVPKF